MNTRRLSLSLGPNNQAGAALVVGLVLLLILTLLAISGMNTATLELRMAGNAQYSQNAFQAAETGIEAAMQAGNFNPDEVADPVAVVDPDTGDTYDTITSSSPDNGMSPDPNGGSSIGVGGIGFTAYHFDIISTGTTSQDATSTHTQSFYIIGPSGS